MADSEKIVVSKKYRPSDFREMISGVLSEIPCKMMFILFIIYIFLSSDVFINRVVSRMDGAVNYIDTLSTYGTVLTGILQVMVYAVFDVLVKKEVV